MKNIASLPIPAEKDFSNQPIRVVQFGEGVFLRAFVEPMLETANEKHGFGGSVAIVKPRAGGSLDMFGQQNNRYTVLLRGKDNGKTVSESRVITCVSKVLNAADDHNDFLALAALPTVRFIISNTTEAGIVLDERDFDPVTRTQIPQSYPGKLTKFLYHRFKSFSGAADKGVIVLPVELIEDNGGKLKSCVLALAEKWLLGENFTAWLNDACIFCSTLVDRIVTGFPKNDVSEIWEELGYRDDLLDIGEPFSLWVIEFPENKGAVVHRELPVPATFTSNQKPYRECKVRVLNGAHTSSVLAGYLCGIGIVRDMMHDELMGAFTRRIVMDEIVPLVPLPEDEVNAFAASVFERFENPFIDHALLAISLNSVSKWKARVLPSFRDYYGKHHKLPPLMTFSYAALLAFYTSPETAGKGLVNDSADVLAFFKETCEKEDFITLAASNTAFWGEDLTAYDGFTDFVSECLSRILADARSAVKWILEF